MSGTGPVVEGVEFTNGWCALRWLSDRSSLCFYQSLQDVSRIHGHGGKTELIVHDFEPLRRAASPKDAEEPEFELFLQVVEELSTLIARSELAGASQSDLQDAITRLHALLDRLQARLASRFQAA